MKKEAAQVKKRGLKMIKVGINGFGRIGRLAARLILKDFKDKIQLVAINTSGKMDAVGWAHLFKYDSVYGKYEGEVQTKGEHIVVDGENIPVMGELDPEKIPWGKYGTEIVIESTGVFRKETDIKKHLRDTVKKVILSAPSKEGNIPIYIIGVNENRLKNEPIISCASCTTNCIAPIIKLIDQKIGVKKAIMTTIHAYTSDQEILDGSHKDLRRSRSAAINIVPTTTGAAGATGKVYPKVKNIFDGLSVRVPVPVGSLSDIVFVTKRKTTKEEVNNIIKEASQKELKNVLGYTAEPLVSSDIIGSCLSCIVDLSLTTVVADDLLKIIAWYDNEWGYINRLVEEILLIAK